MTKFKNQINLKNRFSAEEGLKKFGITLKNGVCLVKIDKHVLIDLGAMEEIIKKVKI
jgi:hypothetical protein